MATQYCVLENNRPACYPSGIHWTVWKYNTYEEAFQYAKLWLGHYGTDITPSQLPVDIPFCYNGGDYIKIAKIKDPQ